ncbi:MAG: RNA-directed DNA polymerase, partial [Planctomycetota bacterium]
DAIDHECLMQFVERRIGDKRVLRHIKKWLNAGVLEDGKKTKAVSGTPQGGSISPLLANIYLHYALDLWVKEWRTTTAQGEVYIVRYVDDFAVCFQHREDAERFLAALKVQLANHQLELHPEKTRLLHFGGFATEDRQRRGEGKPETFDFLGFTHFCAKTRAGRFKVGRKTRRKTMVTKLALLKVQIRKRMHAPVPITGAWLGRVLRGHYQYFCAVTISTMEFQPTAA